MKNNHNTHYGPGLDPREGRIRALMLAKLIAEKLQGVYPILCFTGMSGSTMATRLSDALAEAGIEHGMLYVRKQGEKSHGAPVEACMDDEQHRRVFLFVDDAIGSGATRRRVMSESGHNTGSWWNCLSGWKSEEYRDSVALRPFTGDDFNG